MKNLTRVLGGLLILITLMGFSDAVDNMLNINCYETDYIARSNTTLTGIADKQLCHIAFCIQPQYSATTGLCGAGKTRYKFNMAGQSICNETNPMYNQDVRFWMYNPQTPSDVSTWRAYVTQGTNTDSRISKTYQNANKQVDFTMPYGDSPVLCKVDNNYNGSPGTQLHWKYVFHFDEINQRKPIMQPPTMYSEFADKNFWGLGTNVNISYLDSNIIFTIVPATPSTTTTSTSTTTTTLPSPNTPIFANFNVSGKVINGAITDYSNGYVQMMTCPSKNMCPYDYNDYMKAGTPFWTECMGLTNGWINVNTNGSFRRNNVQGSCQDIIAIYYNNFDKLYGFDSAISSGSGNKYGIMIDLKKTSNISKPTISINMTFGEVGGRRLDNITYSYMLNGASPITFTTAPGQTWFLQNFTESTDYFTYQAKRLKYQDFQSRTYHVDQITNNIIDTQMTKLGGASVKFSLSGNVTLNGTGIPLDGIKISSSCGGAEATSNRSGYYFIADAMSNNTKCTVTAYDPNEDYYVDNKKLTVNRDKTYYIIMYPAKRTAGTKTYTIWAYEKTANADVYVTDSEISLTGCSTDYKSKMQKSDNGVTFTVNEIDCPFDILCAKDGYIHGTDTIDLNQPNKLRYECEMTKIKKGQYTLTVNVINGKGNPIKSGDVVVYIKDAYGNIRGQTYSDPYGKAYFPIEGGERLDAVASYNGTTKSIQIQIDAEGSDVYYTIDMAGSLKRQQPQENFVDFIYGTIMPLFQLILLIFTFGVLFKVLQSWAN